MNECLTFDDIRAVLKDRARDSHKGDNGRALLLAGSVGMSGAAVMAAAAALRGGVGILKVLCPKSICPAFYVLPEAMVHGFEGEWDELDVNKLDEMLQAASCIGAGPGIGKNAGVLPAVKKAIETRKPIVIDADALNALSSEKSSLERLHENVILTPHLGEMSRLTELSVTQIQSDMEECALHYAKRWNCTILLKSAQSVIASADGRCKRNISGNAGLAKGGSGDVLTGITLAMLAQGLSAFDAACAGAYLLGASADEAVVLLKERMLMARDVVGMIESTLQRTFATKNRDKENCDGNNGNN